MKRRSVLNGLLAAPFVRRLPSTRLVPPPTSTATPCVPVKCPPMVETILVGKIHSTPDEWWGDNRKANK